jgi:hypothetical protein
MLSEVQALLANKSAQNSSESDRNLAASPAPAASLWEATFGRFIRRPNFGRSLGGFSRRFQPLVDDSSSNTNNDNSENS